jgi:hypothetical protein
MTMSPSPPSSSTAKSSGLFSFCFPGSEISSEPSYMIMNTAVSSQWGFPTECPANCYCEKYDCNSKDYSQRCGFSDGFCGMMAKSEPPKYKINWIRVYQDPNEELQKVGCSTPERPTRRFIEAHEKLYKMEMDVSSGMR